MSSHPQRRFGHPGLLTSLKVGFFLAVRQIWRANIWTNVLVVCIMTLTFLNLVVVSGLLIGLIAGSFEQYRNDYSGEVIITAETGRTHIENSPALLAFLRNHPAVRSISPRYRVGAQVLGTLTDNPGKNERPNQMSSQLAGIDPALEEATTGFSRFVVSGQSLQEGEEGFILIGANLLRKYSAFADVNIPFFTLLDDVDIGSRVRVTLAREGGGVVSKDFYVKGIVKSKVDELSTRIFATDDEVKRMLPVNKEQFQEIAIRTDPAYAAELSSQIKGFMGSASARIQTSDEAIPSFLRDVEATMAILGNAISSIGLAVAAITIFIVIFINAVTRRKYIGILKGIGVSSLAIEFAYVCQSLFYAVIGTAVGGLFVFGFLKPFIDRHPIDFPFSEGILVATVEGTAIRIAVLIVVTVIAGYIPAKIITRQNTLDAILNR